MAQAQAGDRLAYERVLADSVGLIRAVARRQGVQGALVDDVVQETLLSVHRARHTYDPSRSYNAWLAALAARRAIDSLRQQGRRELRELPELDGADYPDGSEDAAEQIEQELRARKLHEAIAELPDGQRQAVEAALKEQSLAETSAQTGRSATALKVSLHRALKVLRKRMGGGG
jgi:RNA polymerase sigma-70 factor (ECF subfamily)